jgi:hypothetical protein
MQMGELVPALVFISSSRQEMVAWNTGIPYIGNTCTP